MALVPLETLKLHVRVDGDDEAVVLQVYLDAAEGAIAGYLCRKLIAANATPAAGSMDLPLPPPVVAAILLLAGHLYEHRESVVTGTIATELPMTVRFLIAPYRVWGASATS
jgi:hypothetical protein